MASKSLSLRSSDISVILRENLSCARFTIRPCGDTTSGRCLLRTTCENMASVLLGGKKLTDLRVVDLRQELENRGLEKSGVKAVLIERLQKVICRFASKNISNCHVPFGMQIAGRLLSRPAFLYCSFVELLRFMYFHRP